MASRTPVLSFFVTSFLLASCASVQEPVAIEAASDPVAYPAPAPAPESAPRDEDCTPGESLAPRVWTNLSCREVTTVQDPSSTTPRPEACLLCEDAEMECIGSHESVDLIRITSMEKFDNQSLPSCPNGTLFFQGRNQTVGDRARYEELNAHKRAATRERALVQRLLDAYEVYPFVD